MTSFGTAPPDPLTGSDLRAGGCSLGHDGLGRDSACGPSVVPGDLIRVADCPGGRAPERAWSLGINATQALIGWIRSGGCCVQRLSEQEKDWLAQLVAAVVPVWRIREVNDVDRPTVTE
jgi:hypothetical protein